MSIGTIIADNVASSGPSVVGRASQISALSSFDFGALLSDASAQIGLDATGQAMESTAIQVDSVTKTETARSISVVGHLRMTRVQFTDGSSDIQLSAAETASTAIPMPSFQADVSLPPDRSKFSSDLEREIGIDGRRNTSARQPYWKGRPAAGPAARPHRTDTAQAVPPAEMQTRVEALDEFGVGRLFDILT